MVRFQNLVVTLVAALPSIRTISLLTRKYKVRLQVETHDPMVRDACAARELAGLSRLRDGPARQGHNQ